MVRNKVNRENIKTVVISAEILERTSAHYADIRDHMFHSKQTNFAGSVQDVQLSRYFNVISQDLIKEVHLY